MFADHDRVDDEGAEEGKAGYGFDGGGVAERAGLDDVWGEVFENGFDLLEDEIWREDFHARDAARVLDGEKRDGGGAVNVEAMEGFEVGLYAGAPGGVGAGN